MRRRSAFVGVVLAAVVALTGCGGLPTTGPINPGIEAGEAPGAPDVDFLPAGPQPGASPEDIVRGFIDAATSPAGSWERARLFLASGYDDEWEPRAGVTIDQLGGRTFEVDDESVSLTVTPVADVDATGAYRIAESESSTVGFTLAPDSDGEWRITSAPDGIILDSDSFAAVYRAYELMYFDPTWSFLVPDVRWYPRATAVNRIASGLVNGQASPWLAASVATAFPEAVELAPGSVVIREGVAQVELPASVLGSDAATLGRMRLQLTASLQTAGVSSVVFAVDGTEPDVPLATVDSGSVDPRALILTEDGFGYLDGGSVTPVALSAAIESTQASAIALGRGGQVAAVQQADGSVIRVASTGNVESIDRRRGLIAPVIDGSGAVWSVPRSNPDGLVVVQAGGGMVEIENAWAGAATIDAMRISADGTRLAASILIGDTRWLVVSGILHDSDGAPTGVGEPLRLARVPSEARGIAWIDEMTLAAAFEVPNGTQVLEQTIGGPGTRTIAGVDDVVEIVTGNAATAVRLLTEDGVLYSRRGTSWQQTADGVEVLAQQLGG